MTVSSVMSMSFKADFSSFFIGDDVNGMVESSYIQLIKVKELNLSIISKFLAVFFSNIH